MRRFLITAALAGLALAWPAGTAFAHAQLESSSPANGEALASAPTTLVFDFNQAVSLDFGAVTLTDERGLQLRLPEPTLRSPDVVVVDGLPPMSDGQYVAGYQVVSADGHPVSGNIVFRVGAGEVDTSAAVVDGSPDAVDAVYGVVRFLGYPPLAASIGIPLFAATVWSPARRKLERAWRVAAAVLGIATAIQFAVAIPYLSGGGWSTAWSPQQWRTLLGTPTGGWLAARVAASLVLAALLTTPLVRSQWSKLGTVGVAATSTVLIASFVGEGHSSANGWSSVDAASTFVHIALMSLWLAGLGIIAWGLRRDERELLAACAKRWTPTAMVAVALLAATGVVQALAVRPAGAAFSSRYLTELIVKVSLVAAMIALGAAGRIALRRHATASWPGSLRTTVSIELAIAVLVLAATTMLSQTEPVAATSTAATATHEHHADPYRVVIPLRDRSMTVELDDTSIGRRSMTVIVDDSARPFSAPVSLEARLTLPAKGLGPIPIVFTATADRSWTTEQIEIPATGSWQLELFVIDPETKARFSTTIDFHPEGAHQ